MSFASFGKSVCESVSRFPFGATMVFVALTALQIDLGNFHRFHTSDSLMHTIMSTQRWTFFFWDQNRYGAFFALLASPVRDPFWNLLLLYWMVLTCALGSFFALTRYLIPEGPWWAAGALSLLMFLGLTGDLTAFIFIYQPYATAAFWGLTGLIILETPGRGWRRGFFATLALFVSAWICMPMPLMLGLLVLLRHLPDMVGRRRVAVWEIIPAVSLLALNFLIILAISNMWPYRWEYGISPVSLWPESFLKLSFNLFYYYFAHGKIPLTLLMSGASLFFLLRFRTDQDWRTVLWMCFSCLITALAALGLFAFTDWVLKHDFRPDYAASAYFFLQGAISILVISACFGRVRDVQKPYITGMGMVLIVGVSLAVYGWPSVRGVDRDLDAFVGPYARQVIDLKASHVMGEFTRVWPVAFYANVLRYRQGQREPIHVISAHATTTRDRWSKVPRERVRVATFRNDPQADHYREGYRLPPLEPVAQNETFIVLSPVRKQ
ncbi:MAG: hypothetical protein SFY92_04645 [Verrucomicrobiae bacterium]|nr:hypothetical protein [Verrucomicrobiae bacterium]